MKLLYVVRSDLDDASYVGVKKKILAQLKIFQEHFQSDLMFLNKNKIMLGDSVLKVINPPSGILGRYMKFKAYRNLIYELSRDYQVIYVRYTTPDPILIKTLQKIKKNCLLVLELPTNGEAASKEIKRIEKKLLFSMFYQQYIELFDVVAVCTKASEFEKRLPSDKVVVFTNGFDVESVSPKVKLEANPDEEFHLISVANNSFWHGYDRVIKGLYNYYRNNPSTKVIYHVVGVGDANKDLEKLTKDLELEKYVIFHGPKFGDELWQLYNISHIAISSLGDHRKGLFSASVLKSREYCAVGIPFVYSTPDPDFPERFKFSQKVPQTDEPINIEELIRFYKNISQYDYIKEMRTYAEQNLTWKVKMKPIIEKIFEKLSQRQGI